MNSSKLSQKNKGSEPLGPVVLVGHRGSGKSTLGRLVATILKRPFVDLDEELFRLGGPLGEQLQDRKIFREREVRALHDLCSRHPSAIIACGAGVERVPREAFVVWIDREDWRDEVQASDRPRVRPDLTLQQEWAWMDRTRRPRWERSAHLKLAIARGREVNRSADELATLLRFSESVASSHVAAKTFFVPLSAPDLLRAIQDARRFGFAGVEVRSDRFPERPLQLQGPFLASLRHEDPGWLEKFPDAWAWDIDLRSLDYLPRSSPKRLILSLHPDDVDGDDVERLIRAAETLGRDDIIIKFAPVVETWAQLESFVALRKKLRAADLPHTALPQGRFGWIRPIFAAENQTNYLPVGLSLRNPDHPSALDFQGFLPHLAGSYPTRFDGLIGDPVQGSQGDIWHRRAALADDEEDLGYLKIQVRRGEFADALPILSSLPIRGLSVTSPLKREAAANPKVKTTLEAINTLRRASPWAGIDTDEVGMDATLATVEAEEGVGPGRAILLGRGGVSSAICRALKRRGWELVAQISARQGFQQDHQALGEVDLIVNAGGPSAGRSPHAPPYQVWLDLHYRDIHRAPRGARHLIGDLFFDAQARAQRTYWNHRLLEP